MKVREMLKLIQDDGWFLVGTRGSHHHFAHPLKRGKITVAGTLNQDLRKGTAHAILKQAGLR